MVNWFNRLLGRGKNANKTATYNQGGFVNGSYSGDKFPGGFGPTRNYTGIDALNYYQLRTRSRQLFTNNIYASQIITRKVTNIINEGLKLGCTVKNIILNLDDEYITDWEMKTEALYSLWGNSTDVDYSQISTLGALEQVAYREALIDGDILVIVRFNKITKLPTIDLVPGYQVQTNMQYLRDNKDIRVIDGVELNSKNKHVAYHINYIDADGRNKYKRVPAIGSKSGRVVSFLLYGTPPTIDKVRGTPILSRILQPLNQINDTLDSEILASKINSTLALVVEKTEEKPGSNPFGRLTRKTPGEPNDTAPIRPMYTTDVSPGMIINELQYGEVVKSFDTKRPNVNWKDFKECVLADIAASVEIPPEVLRLEYGSNYSASRQAAIDWGIYVTKSRAYFSNQFNKQIYKLWLRAMILKGRIEATGYIEAVRTNDQETTRAWESAKFSGIIRENVDRLKEVKAVKEMVDAGIMTRQQACDELSGADYPTTITRLTDENQDLATAREPLLGTITTNKSITANVSEDDINSIDNENI